ncbi:RNA 2',3'-cyclic phosphodiesterase [Bacillus sp. FSL K6-3431]|uniref:RNA 2',3'-cyclic phosphodiesterase n=1 Tax=Bacillus sp. FSL K6-3431 TaxID=2921500 RepID=UPI0030F67D6D
MSHYFFALVLPNEVKQRLKQINEELQARFPFKNWVHLEDYHITLAFLGHADEPQLQEAIKLSEKAIKNTSTFFLELGTIGIFGPAKAPRILWMGTKEADSLIDVQKRVYQACIHAKFKLDEKPFKSHITLARKWIGANEFLLETNSHDMKFKATEVALFRTNPKNTPKYEKVQSFKLQA